MTINYLLPIRGFQAALAITVLGLISYGPFAFSSVTSQLNSNSRTVSSWWSTHWRQSSPMEINFLIFTPTWTVLALAPLLVVPLRLPHLLASAPAKWAMLALEGLTMVYWFGGFVALSVFLSDRICFGLVCDVARASTAISALNWVVWTGTFVMGVVEMVKRGGFRARRKKEEDTGKVEMHQGV